MKLRQPWRVSRRKLTLALVFSIAAATMGASGETPGADSITARSASGQFVSLYPRRGLVSPYFREKNQTNYLVLTPMLMPVSCERVKQAVWRELEISGPFSGKIYLTLRPAQSGDDPVILESERFASGWQYRLNFPDVVEQKRYLRAVVQAVLLEYANRQAGDRAAEVPRWLIDGFTEQLLGSSRAQLLLRPPEPGRNGIGVTSVFVPSADARRIKPLELGQPELRARPPLSFDKLSWPESAQLDEASVEHYRESAKFFLAELLTLPDGRRGIRKALEKLPAYFNWQFAFLQGFEGRFQQVLDVEKWWELRIEDVTGADVSRRWPAGESRQRLASILKSAVQVRSDSTELPTGRSEMSLQAIIADWPADKQKPVLKEKLVELQLASLRVNPAFSALAKDYFACVEEYLQALKDAPRPMFPYGGRSSTVHAAEKAVRTLNELDRRLAQISDQNPTAGAPVLAGNTQVVEDKRFTPLQPPRQKPGLP